MTVDLTEEQIRALLAILDSTQFRGQDREAVMALYAALLDPIEKPRLVSEP